LIINELHELYHMDLSDYLFAAAYHDRASITGLNKLRFKEYDIEAYYNSGVLLMNLPEQRKTIKEQDIYDLFHEKYKDNERFTFLHFEDRGHDHFFDDQRN